MKQRGAVTTCTPRECPYRELEAAPGAATFPSFESEAASHVPNLFQDRSEVACLNIHIFNDELIFTSFFISRTSFDSLHALTAFTFSALHSVAILHRQNHFKNYDLWNTEKEEEWSIRLRFPRYCELQ